MYKIIKNLWLFFSLYSCSLIWSGKINFFSETPSKCSEFVLNIKFMTILPVDKVCVWSKSNLQNYKHWPNCSYDAFQKCKMCMRTASQDNKWVLNPVLCTVCLYIMLLFYTHNLDPDWQPILSQTLQCKENLENNDFLPIKI